MLNIILLAAAIIIVSVVMILHNRISYKLYRNFIIGFLSLILFISPLNYHNDIVLAAGNDPCATPGKDGSGTINGIVNSYFAANSGTVNSGVTSITVNVASKLPNTAPDIAVGDLLMIIQMQDADIDSSNTASYGDGTGGDVPAYSSPEPTPPTVATDTPPSTGASGLTAINNAGHYEFITVTSVSGSTIGIKGTGTSKGLNYTYRSASATSTAGRRSYQIIRVPQYSSVTLNAGVTALPWDGTVGGVFAIDVAGKMTLGGGTIVDLRGKGFRAGAGRQLRGTSGGANTDYRTNSQNSGTTGFNGSKGESIAGTPKFVLNYFDPSSISATNGNPPTATFTTNTDEGYPNGSYGRGAPANAGGGSTDGNPSSNDQNSGGGGGANGGDGGRGGRAWSSQVPSGGFGGKAFTTALINNGERLFMGGGGGAGTTNDATTSVSRTLGTNYTGSPTYANGADFDGNNKANSTGIYSSGGAGGGIAVVRADTIAGSGIFDVRGVQGLSIANDGAGGGGAGGTVYAVAYDVKSTGTTGISNLSVNAAGGDGGWSTFREAHGPGGGGGGGVVVSTSAAATVVSLAGGAGGQTGLLGNANPRNFYAAGGTGLLAPISANDSPGIKSGAQCLPKLTVTKTTSTPTITKPGTGAMTATYTITVSNAALTSSATNVVISDLLPTGFTYASTTSVTTSSGATQPTSTNPTGGATNPSWGTFTIPEAESVTIVFKVDIPNATALGTYQNPATATYDDPTRTTAGGTTTASYNSASSTGEDVTIIGIDYGDAPDTSNGTGAGDYQTTLANGGASHNIVSTLKMGANIDADDSTLQNANADADDTTGTPDDEDGVTLPAINTSTTSYTATVNVTNTAAAAYLVGWIDFNKDGVFAVSEGVAYDSNTSLAGIQPIAVSATAQNINIQWIGITGLTAGDTYARFRLSDSATLTTSTPNTAIANGEVEDYKISIGAVPNLSLVKRITAINGTNITTTFVNDSTANDDASGWPTNKDKYLRGAIACNTGNACNSVSGVLPGDNLEYTIYFLSSGTDNLKNVKICDRIPTNTTFQADTYAVGNGILLGWDNTALADPSTSTGTGKVQLTNTADSDRGQFYSAGTSLPNPPCGAATNTNGGVVVDLGTSTIVPKATAAGTPFASYGFVRFNVTVN
ncbi:DUF11 domain-containing protein [Nostoc linckia FACHB-104]|nr:DUF11 domain-containing protein [Nostoc linckia FACHB-104]